MKFTGNDNIVHLKRKIIDLFNGGINLIKNIKTILPYISKKAAFLCYV